MRKTVLCQRRKGGREGRKEGRPGGGEGYVEARRGREMGTLRGKQGQEAGGDVQVLEMLKTEE